MERVTNFSAFSLIESLNEGMMSELDLMAKEAKDLKDFMKEVFSIDIYKKHKGSKDVEEFLSKFYKEAVSESTDVNEAMVQVAGRNKPSGAFVLAKVISEALVESGYCKPNSRDYKKMVAMIQDVIMDSTF